MKSPQPTTKHQASSEPHPVTDPAHPGYETRDVNLRGILYLGLGVAISAVVISLGLWWLFNVYEQQAASLDPQLTPLYDANQKPPAPNLQSQPNRDFQEFRRQQEERLSTYGWIDQQQKVVRIPVERAMELLLERGLPTPSGPATPEQDAAADPPSTSSGNEAMNQREATNEQ